MKELCHKIFSNSTKLLPRAFPSIFLGKIPGDKVEFSRVENATEWVKHENNGSEQITRSIQI